MAAHLSIGDFSRATLMTVKALRHYHRIGLLEPAEIDDDTGYRRYSVEQLRAAQVIRRFRELGMPLDEIHGVLSAPDLDSRNQRITAHLSDLERELSQTQSAAASLRDLIATPSRADTFDQIELRTVPAVSVVAITEAVDAEGSVAWLQAALAELRDVLAASNVPTSGIAGGVYADELFTKHHGEVTIFVPCVEPVHPAGRVTTALIPTTELAVIEHRGPPTEIDRAYGTLAAYVARHAIAIDGPIREYYLVGQNDTLDSADWRTEVGWPIFRTSGP